MRILLVLLLAACVGPTHYQRVTDDWTRSKTLGGNYQQIITLAAVYKSAEWRAAYAEKDADARGLSGAARDQRLAQAKADAAGQLEFELLVTTWDPRENDLDRKKASWHVRMLDAAGAEVVPTEITKDKRPKLVLRSEFPSMGDFATAYVVKFARPAESHDLRLRVSSERGGVEVAWAVR